MHSGFFPLEIHAALVRSGSVLVRHSPVATGCSEVFVGSIRQYCRARDETVDGRCDELESLGQNIIRGRK
jgi:hypothetical protein